AVRGRAPLWRSADGAGPRSQPWLGGGGDGARRPRDADHDGERRAAGRRGSDVARGAARPVERRRRRPPEAALTAARWGRLRGLLETWLPAVANSKHLRA